MLSSNIRRRKIGLVTITASIAVVIWSLAGFVLYSMLKQQAHLEVEAQRVYDGSSARVYEATRTIRGLERLAREGDAITWVADPSIRKAKRQRMQSLVDDAALQGEPDLRAIVKNAFLIVDENLADLERNGASAQERSAQRWAPVMQDVINKSEAIGAEASDVATREADRILQSTEDARALLTTIAVVSGVSSVALFVFFHLMLTRPIIRLAKALFSARDGNVISGQQEIIYELQMLDDAAVALGFAHHEMKTAQRLANTDALTGLANRRMFEEQGQRALSQTRRYGQTLIVVVFDIDHFKQINDEYGHETGDVVLRALGDYLRDAVRAAEYPVARIGGEEFALLLTHTPQESAILLAERLRKGIETMAVTIPNGTSIRITVSMGVAQCRASDNNLSTLMRRADIALYTAKHNGRNRIEQANSATKPLPFL